MKRIITYIVLATVLLITACTEDPIPADQQTKKQTLTLIPYTQTFFDAEEMPTRALPSGYVRYEELYPTTTFTSIYVKLAQDATTSANNYDIRLLNGTWTAQLNITNATYYIFGFMPSEMATGISIVKKDGSFANGATMTINNLNVLTPADVCVVVGVKRAEQATPIEDSGIQLGQFEYQGSEQNNFLYLLLKHIYAGLHFKIHIDSEYAKLRTIRVKKVTLTTANEIHDKINLTVNLTANNTNTDPCTGNIIYADAGTAAHATTTLYDDAEGFEVPIQSPESFLGCFAPGKCSEFNLTSTYDVYDRKGNLIRQNQTATNHISAEALGIANDINTLLAGEIYTIDLKLQPTYLYVLSDPDLDNPTFVPSIVTP